MSLAFGSKFSEFPLVSLSSDSDYYWAEEPVEIMMTKMRHWAVQSEWLYVKSKCLFMLPLDEIYKRERHDLTKEMSLRVCETANELWTCL